MINTELVESVLNFISRFIKNFENTYSVLLWVIGIYCIVNPYNINNLINKMKCILPGDTFDLKRILDKEHNFDPVKAKEQLRKVTDGRKLLVIIDNIDRLYPFQIKKIFDLVKGMGDLPNIIYILAFDKQIVSKALNKEHVEQDSKYLDKFIQYQILLHTTYEQQVINAIKKEFNDSDAYYSKKLSQYITNIRELKRLIHALKQNYKTLKDDVIFYQLLYITAIGLQNHEVYYLISQSKEILCSPETENKESSNKEKLREELDIFKPSIVLRDIIETLFPIIYKKDFLDDLFKNKDTKRIDNYDYFDIYFKISFPDDLVSDENFDLLVAEAHDKDKLSKMLLKLLIPDEEEGKQKIPNRIHYPFKWLNSLTDRILERDNFDNIPNWLLSLAKITEKYAGDVEDAQNKQHVVPCFHDFLDKLAQLLQKEDPAEDNDIALIYAFLRIYLKETGSNRQEGQILSDRTLKLRGIVIDNIKKYSKNNNISQLSFFATIIRFASSNHEEHEVIVSIIKETIKQNDALLKLIQYSIQTENGKYVATQYLEYYISFKEAVQRLEGIRQSESSKSYDIDTYINALLESIINKEKTQGTSSF